MRTTPTITATTGTDYYTNFRSGATDDFNEIQQNLTIVGDSIFYKVKGTGEEIPISTIASRPDGIGYGTNWKLEMKLHPKLAEKLEEQRDKGK